jgi:glycerophosphoryl diester phosphodiesterase
MLDRSTFFRPIAHRGLHDAKRARIENTAPAFAAAIAGGYGIECDLQPLADGTPVVFHDETLDRLIEGTGRIGQLTRGQCKKLRYKAELGGAKTGIITFADFLDMVGGQVPLLVEIKSEWLPLPVPFLRAIAELSRAYKGPLALMRSIRWPWSRSAIWHRASRAASLRASTRAMAGGWTNSARSAPML